MFYLVLKAKFTDNVQQLPLEWPIVANPCEVDTVPYAGWEKLTGEELDALQKEHQTAYDTWKANKEDEKIVRYKEEKLAHEAPCKSAEGKFEVLGFTNEEIKKIMGANHCE